MESNNLLNKLNNLTNSVVQYKRLKDLVMNFEYSIMEAEKTYSEKFKKFNVSIKISDVDGNMFRVSLPARYSCLTKKEVEGLIGYKFYYSGETAVPGTSYFQSNVEFRS